MKSHDFCKVVSRESAKKHKLKLRLFYIEHSENDSHFTVHYEGDNPRFIEHVQACCDRDAIFEAIHVYYARKTESQKSIKE